ncbi:MAG: hypothetical protein ACJ8E5_01970 [Xanthobacteraceae bacterium]
MASLAPSFENGGASGWEVGVTETGDPQLYLLGPAPDHECILCVSRLGSLYVLEDGAGRVLFEHDSLRALAETVKAVLRNKKAAIVARAALAWFVVREAFAEKVEAMLGESEELLVHFAPQLAALA